MVQEITANPGVASVTASPNGRSTITHWRVVPERTTVTWAASKRYFMVIPVSPEGTFTGATGTVDIDGRDLTTARVDLRVPAATQSSGNARRDKHVEGPAFFDVASHPEVTFRSTSIRPIGGAEERYVVSGELGIKGQTYPITLEGSWHDGAGGLARVELTGTVSRTALGMTWNAKPMINLLDPIVLTIEAELEPTGR